MLFTHSSLETFEVGGKDWIRHSWFSINPLHHLHLVCHLKSGLKTKQPKPVSAAVSNLHRPQWSVCTLHVNSLPVEKGLTCGTHFGDTKLVASMTGRPESDNMSMRWTLVSVGTIV